MGHAPVPECHPDGSFQLLRSNEEVIVGNCLDPNFRLSRRLICTTPDAWYADCNVVEEPLTLRIYRLGEKQTPEEVHRYSFNANTNKWDLVEPEEKGDSDEQPSKPGLFHSITKRIGPLIRFLRWLLGDFEEWPAWGKYKHLRIENMDPTGQKSFGDGPFYPEIILYENGDVVLEDTHFKPARKINKTSNNERFRFFRKRGRFQLLYILKNNSQGTYEPHAVLSFEYGEWWVWKKVGRGSLSDLRSIAGKRAALFLYILGVIYIVLIFFR